MMQLTEPAIGPSQGTVGQVTTEATLRAAVDLACSCKASAILVAGDWPPPEIFAAYSCQPVPFVAVVRDGDPGPPGLRTVRIPSVHLTRMGQIKVAALAALANDMVRNGETIVFVSGVPGSGILDTIVTSEVSRESEMFAFFPDVHSLPKGTRPSVLERLVQLAAELGSEGREGKPVGTMFVIGDSDRVMGYAQQLILNPFRGYAEEERNVLDRAVEETVKEFSALDGAFLIRGDGVIETCGIFLRPATSNAEVPRGLGSRHLVAAGITSLTDSIAITVSESTGTVTVFRAGRILTQLEKPRRMERKQHRH